MSISALNAVWKLETIPGMDKSVLLALADYANADGLCWPSVKTLARKAGWSERAVQEAIGRLTERKMIEVEKGIARGRQTVNRYVVLPGREEGRGAPGSPLEAGGVRVVRGEGARGSPLRGARGSPPLILEPSGSESSSESGSMSISEDRPLPQKFWWKEETTGRLLRAEFQKWYGAYPNKKNPRKAERAYFLARKRDSGTAILAGLMRARESEEWARVAKDGGSIVPHPATWLNGDGWKSEYTALSAAGTAQPGIAAFLAKGKGE